MERPPQKRELSEVELEIFNKINGILDAYFDKLAGGEVKRKEFLENHEKIVALGKILKEKGLKPGDFILWHRLVGSGILGLEHLIGSFDTPDGDIEDFIIDTFEKYL